MDEVWDQAGQRYREGYAAGVAVERARCAAEIEMLREALFATWRTAETAMRYLRTALTREENDG